MYACGAIFESAKSLIQGRKSGIIFFDDGFIEAIY